MWSIRTKKSEHALSIGPNLVRLGSRKVGQGAAPGEENTVQYLLMIYETEANRTKVNPADMGKMMAEYKAFTESIVGSGNYKGGNALEPIATATTVRVREGKVVSTDGPFAETREQLGGYYLIEAKNLDEAISIAARIPSAKWGSVEVRPIRVFRDEM
jgi:hypothetical protein